MNRVQYHILIFLDLKAERVLIAAKVVAVVVTFQKCLRLPQYTIDHK